MPRFVAFALGSQIVLLFLMDWELAIWEPGVVELEILLGRSPKL